MKIVAHIWTDTTVKIMLDLSLMAFIQFCYFLRWWIYDNNRLSALVDKAVQVAGVGRVNSVTYLPDL